MENTKPKEKDLPCLFENLVEKYQGSQLAQCETKERQQWCWVSGEKATERVKLLSHYFPELLLLLNSLNKYSLCEKHYNQLVANDYFVEHLKKIGSSSHAGEDEAGRKKPKLVTDNYEDHTRHISIQIFKKNHSAFV